MISQFDPAMSRRHRRWSAAVTVAALALGGVALTDAVRAAAPAAPAPAVTSPDGRSQPTATQAKAESRIPILSDLPIVGRLFVKTTFETPAATETPSAAPPAAPGESSPRDTPAEGTPPTTPPPVGAGGPPSAPVTAPPLAETTVEVAPPSAPGDVTVAAAGSPEGSGISAQKIRAVVEAKLHRAKAAVAIAQEQARMKQQQVERLSQLDQQHVVSREEVDRAKSEAEVARLQVEQARADLEQAEASLQAAIAGKHQAEGSARGAPAAPPPQPGVGAPPPGAMPGVGAAPRGAGGPFVPGPGQPPAVMGGYPALPPPAGGGMAGGPMMPPGAAQGRLALRAYDIADLVGDSPNSANQANQLVNLITQMVGPDQWNTGSGATLGVFRTKLIVKASESAQKEIVELLDMLRHGDGDDNARAAPTPRRNPGPGRDRGGNRTPSAAPRGAGGPSSSGTDAPATEEPTPPAAPGAALELPPGHPPIPAEPSGHDEKPKVP